MSESANEPRPVPALDQLATALAAFQAEMPTVPKAHTATVRSEKGSFSYTYAGLADVSEAAMPLLAKHGLSFSCLPGAGVLTGILLHSSGQSLTASLPINGGTPQQVGSALTYMRRYLLGCMTGLVTDDDEDGALASAKPARKRPAQQPVDVVARLQAGAGTQPAGAKTADSKPLDVRGPLAKAMFAALNEAGVPDNERLTLTSKVIGREITTSKEMTEDDARKVLNHLDALDDAKGDEDV